MMAATDKSLGCYKVTVGASDVKGESFLQASQGLMFGSKPYDTVTTDAVTTTGGYNPYYDRSTVFVNSNGLDTSSITKVYSPVIVPFAFYVNNGVLMADGTTHVTNLTRLQAVSLFSGGIKNWSDFGPAYKSQHATICLRHAGSGSHATLDGAVMNGGAWGSGLVQIANNANEDATGMLNAYDNTAADVIFNDGTGDELQCVSNYAGAVGYADADAAYGKASSYPGIFPNGAASGSIAPINYQGAAPTATNIINGVYDFWTKEQMYVSNTATTAEASIVNKMQGYLNNSAHLVGASYEGYWASLADLGAKGITKGSDYLYPSR
jgi:ABC-type phosphate transport system substrate-binding protein